MEWTFLTIFLVYLGFLFGGDLVVISVILSLSNSLEDYFIMTLLVALATLTSDSFLYIVGRKVGYQRVINWPVIKKQKQNIDTVFEKIENNIFFLVFLSKFVYGTRLATQIVTGLKKISYLKAMTFGVLGATIWFSILVLLHSGVSFGLSFVPQSYALVGFSVAVFIVIASVFIIFVSRFLKRKYFN